MRSMLKLAVLALVLVAAPAHAMLRVVAIGQGTEVTVGTNAVLLDDTSLDVPAGDLKLVTVCNPSGNGILYVGGSGVTAAKGLPVRPGNCYTSALLAGDVPLYGIAEASMQVRVQEERVRP